MIHSLAHPRWQRQPRGFLSPIGLGRYLENFRRLLPFALVIRARDGDPVRSIADFLIPTHLEAVLVMKHSQPNDPKPDDPTNRRKGRYGCLPIALAIACGLLLAMLALMSGALCFFITRATGPATLATMIVAAVSAAAVVCLASPLGAALYWLLAPGNEHAVTRSIVSLSIAVLVLILHSHIILGGAVIGAIGGAALFRISDPSTASVFGAIGFTLLGVLTGFAAGGPGGDES